MPKFKVGDLVTVDHTSGLKWAGAVEKILDTGDGIEYWVSNAPPAWPGGCHPLLAWENEVTLND